MRHPRLPRIIPEKKSSPEKLSWHAYAFLAQMVAYVLMVLGFLIFAYLWFRGS